MQAALNIVAHALRMLVFEVHTTLRVLLPALALLFGSTVAAVILAGDTLAFVQQVAPDQAPPVGANVFLLFLLGLTGLAGYALMAILWHRHVLLSGMDRGNVSRPSLRVFFSYVGRALLVGLVQILVAIPVTFGMGMLLAFGGGGDAVAAVIGILGGIVFAWVALRISLILPAAALSARMSIPDSWEATRTVAASLWGVALILAGLNLVLYLIAGLLLPGQFGASFVIRTMFFALEGLIFISILTTLYGHLVEGRSLD